MPTVLIAGGTGTIGIRLSELLLQKGYEIIILSRKQSIEDVPSIQSLNKKYGNISLAQWDLKKNTIDQDAISNTDYIINLAGAGIAEKRWTKERKKEIVNSRKQSCALIIQALKMYSNHVKAVINASATGWYGTDSNENMPEGFTEDMPAAHDYLGDTCKAWEESIAPVSSLNKRLVILRTGIVLSKNGGAFTEFQKPLNFRVATILGNGKQTISWIHEDDMCHLYIHAIEQDTLHGIYNAVAPYPVSNKDLILAMAKEKYGKLFLPLPVPAFALKIALGEMSQEVLKSTKINTDKIRSTGFIFDYPYIEDAVRQLLSK